MCQRTILNEKSNTKNTNQTLQCEACIGFPRDLCKVQCVMDQFYYIQLTGESFIKVAFDGIWIGLLY